MSRILFIDDDPMTLETFHKAVEIFGHQAILASTAADGLTAASEQAPDIIFVDMRLPDMDGLTLAKRLRSAAETSQIPVLMLSAGPELDMAERAAKAGIRAYLSKPIRLQALLDAINEHALPGGVR